MTSLRVLIADDEPLSRDCLRIALASEPDVELIGECEDGLEAAEAIPQLAPDLAFLDVRMPGLDAFGVIERVGPERMPPVVFVTAFEEHAVRAFSMHALDYILKPFDDARFAESLAHARTQIGLRRDGELARRLAALVRGAPPDPATSAPTTAYTTRLLIRAPDRSFFVPVDEVDWLAAERNYVRIHRGASSDVIRATLESLGSQLDPSHFVRIHRSTIVNVARIREIRPWFGGDSIAVLADGRELRVSRTCRDQLLRSM